MKDKPDILQILMTTDTLGGVWTYSLELIKALEAYPVQFHLIGFGGYPSAGQLNELESLKNVWFYPSKLRLEWMQNPEIEGIKKKIIEVYKEVQPDLIHFNNYIGQGDFRDIPTITVFHSCVNSWWQAVKKENAPESWNTYYKLVKKALTTTDKVIFPTQAIGQKAKEIYGFSGEPTVIYNARELSDKPEIEKENIILATGRIWDEAKNLGSLCQTATHLPWPVFIAGDSKEPGSEKEVCLQQNVNFLGKLTSPEIEAYFFKSEIYVNPGLYEPFGLAVLEAAQAGCALVLSDLDTLKEIWEDSAIYFNPDDSKQLEIILSDLIEHPRKRKKYQEKAQSRAKAFQRKAFAKNYYQLYQEVLKPHPDQFHFPKKATTSSLSLKTLDL